MTVSFSCYTRSYYIWGHGSYETHFVRWLFRFLGAPSDPEAQEKQHKQMMILLDEHSQLKALHRALGKTEVFKVFIPKNLGI